MARTELRTNREPPKPKSPSPSRTAPSNRQQNRSESSQTGNTRRTSTGYTTSDVYAGAPATDGRKSSRNVPPSSPRRTERVRNAESGKYGRQIQQATAAVRKQIASLPEAQQAAFLNALGEDPKRAEDLLAILTSRAWQGESGLTEEQKKQVAELVSYAGTRGLRSLARLVHEPKKLASTDLKSGRTLLENLVTLAKQPLHPSMANASRFDAAHRDWEKETGSLRTALLDDVIREATRLSTVDQGNADTCSATTIQQDLIRENPAEFVRLMAGLASRSGKVTMAGGDPLVLQQEGLRPSKNEVRGPSSMIFQSALMEMANGKVNYNAKTDRRSDKHKTGLTQAEQITALQQVFGKQFADFTPTRDANGALPPNYLAFSTDFLKKHKLADGPVLLSMMSPDKKTSHTVTFVGMTADGRYLVRDPEGFTNEKVGSKDNWGWKVEGKTGMYSLSKAQLDKYLRGWRAPADSVSKHMKDWRPPESNAAPRTDTGPAEPPPYELIPIFDMPAIKEAERKANLDFINQFIFGTPDNRIPYEDFLAANGVSPRTESPPYLGYGQTPGSEMVSYPALTYLPYSGSHPNNYENQSEEATPAYNLYPDLRG